MKELNYRSGVTGRNLDLESTDVWMGPARSFRNRVWSYKLGGRGAEQITRDAREAKLTVEYGSREAMDKAEEQFEADLTAGRPGVISAYTMNDKEWTQNAYIPLSESTDDRHGLTCDLTILLLDGVWRHQLPPTDFNTSIDITSGIYLDLPTDVPYDLKPGSISQKITNPSLTPMPWISHIYGPCTDPYFRIRGNLYQVNCEIPPDGYLTITALAGQKSVILTDAVGGRTDVFAKARRGRGLNGGEYIFQPIPAGTNEVTWPNTFGFDIAIVQERSTPPWSI